MRLLGHSDKLDHMNWFLSALSVGSLLGGCKVLSCAFVRVLYRFHLRFGADEPLAPTHTNLPLGVSVELIALTSKLALLTALSTLSSVLVCVCVVMVGLLTVHMDDTLLFTLFIGHAIDVAGNCLAMYLAVSMGNAHYKLMCGPAQTCCQDFCIAMARRAHQRKLKREAAQRNTVAVAVEPSTADLAIDRFSASIAVIANRRLSQRVSQNR